MTDMHFRLKEERVRLGLNQADFGALGGVKKDAQLKYENGKRVPDSLYLSQLGEAGVDVLYVLTGVHNEAHKLLSLLKLATEIATKVGGTQEEMANMQETLFNQLKALQLKDDEHELLANYRQCSEEGKATVRSTCSAFANQVLK